MEFKRLFTRQEAESTLPLVRQIVADVLETAGKIREREESDDELPRLQSELEEHLLELEEMGCFFKDWNFSMGLVDFPAVIDGETVFLCWRSDESELTWGITPSRKAFRGAGRCQRPHPSSDISESLFVE